MNRKGQTFAIALVLDLNRDYEFRYLLDGRDWRNDDKADAYICNPFGSENSIVTTYPNVAFIRNKTLIEAHFQISHLI